LLFLSTDLGEHLSSSFDWRLLKDWRIWALTGLFFLLAAASVNDVFVYIPDSARYLVWAESLSQFRGFVDSSGPDPLRYVVHAPLYALLLTPAAFVFPGSVAAAKILTVLFGVILILLVYAFLAGRIGKTPAIVGSAFLVLNPLHLLFSTQVLSDVPFGVLFVALLILTDKLAQRPIQVDGFFILFALLVSAGVLLREVGMALVFACGLLFFFRKEYLRMAVIFALPLAIYALWFLRNEILVAGVEQPPLRNSDLFLSHLYTVREESLVSEMAARVSSNLRIYAGLAGKLLFFTQYDVRGYGIIPPGDFLFGWILRNARFAIFPASILGVGCALVGLVHEWKNRESTRLVVFFLLFYVPLILIYPFNDIRFLFPLLVIMILFGTTGAAFAVRKLLGEKPAGRNIVIVGVSCVFLLAIPNGAWVYSFVKTNSGYRTDPHSYFRSVALRPDAPELLMFPMSRIGHWISDNTSPSAVIATRWKQLSFWLEGRKLLELNPLLPVDQFENQIRDYKAEYLVALLDRSRLREFETQMALSSRFFFTPVHRIGNAVVLRIGARGRSIVQSFGDSAKTPVSLADDFLDSLNRSDELVQYLFREGLHRLESGHPDEADRIFQSLSTRAGRSGTVVLHSAIAKSFAGRYQEADTLLRNIREGQQAGPLLIHSWYHLQIIEKLSTAERLAESPQKADLLTRAAVDYWSLGFGNRAERILRKALESDAAFTPAMVFGVYFSLQKRDTARATRLLERLRFVDSFHKALRPFENLISYADSAQRTANKSLRSMYMEKVVQSYLQLGLLESAIDELILLLEHDPSNVGALRMLGEIYVDKGRYAPARGTLEQLLSKNPQDSAASALSSRLRDRWGE